MKRTLLTCSIAGCASVIGACSSDDGPTRPPLEITIETTALQGATSGEAYSASIEASGGTNEGFRWSLSSGNLPGGMMLREEGTPSTRLTGAPLGSGAFTFTVQVKDSMGTTATRQLTLEVAAAPPPLEITTAELPNGGTEVAYEAMITAQGGSGAAYQWRLLSGALPPGLALLPGTPSATLEGTPPPGAFGDYEFSVEVTDSANNRVDASYMISIADNAVPLNVVTADIPDGEVDFSYAATIEAEGGRGAYTWQVQGGTLPDGVVLDEEGTGTTTTLSGTPTTRGSFTFQIQVQDEEGNRSRKTFFIDIAPAPPPIRITTPDLPPGEQGTMYSATVGAINGSGQGYTWSVLNGQLPAGLTLAASGTPDTTISGTPTEFGTFDFTIQVTDDRGNSDDVSYTLRIQEEVLPIRILGQTNGTIVLPAAEGGTSYTTTLTAADGFGGYSWVVSAGALPNGLAIAVPGTPSTTISGIPQQLGTFTATVTVYDWNNDTASVRVVVTVSPPPTLPTIQTTDLPDASICAAYSASLTATGGSNANYVWTVENGTLPPGFVLTSGTPTARISGGSGTTVASYTFTIRVTDTFGLTDTASFTVDVTNAPGGFRWVATIGDVAVSSMNEVYVSEVCGQNVPSAPITVSPPGAVAGGDVQTGDYDVSFSPAGNALAYVADFTNDNRYDIYMVPLDTGVPGTPINVSANLPFDTSRNALDLRWSLDGTKIAFRADGNTSGADELYVVDVTNMAMPRPAVLVSQQMNSSSTDVFAYDYEFSPDSTKIAYVADVTSSRDRLYVVDISGLATGGAPGAPQEVAGSPNASADFNGMAQWTPDSRALVFNADYDIAFQDEMYWVDVSGAVPGTPVRLVPNMPLNGDCISLSNDHNGYWSISPDGTKLAALCEAEMNDARLPYIWDISGTVPGPMQRAIGFTPTPGLYSYSLKWSPDSTHLAAVGDLVVGNAFELYVMDVSGALPAVPIDASQTGQSANFAMYTGAYHAYEWSPDSSMIAFTKEAAPVNSAYQLFVLDLSQGPPYNPVALRPMHGSSDDFWNMQFSPDGTKLAAFGYLNFEYVLGVVDLTGPTPGPFTLAHSDPPSSSFDLATYTTSGWGGFYTWFWTADSSSLVFPGDLRVAFATEAFISDVSGAPPYTETVISPAGGASGREIFNIWGQGRYSRRIDGFWR